MNLWHLTLGSQIDFRFVFQARGMSTSSENILDAIEASKQAGLRYVTDAEPGITRKRRGKNFHRIPQAFPGDAKFVQRQNTIDKIADCVFSEGK